MTTPLRQTAKPEAPEVDVLAGFAAVVFPGLGHLIRGHTARGVYAAIGVMGMFLGGLLIGGISVVDSRDARVWFVGQALVGPVAFAVDYANQNHFKAWGPSRGNGFGELAFRSGYPGETRVPATAAGGRAVWERAPATQNAGPETLPSIPSIGRVNEIGTLYGTLAGMLNLIIVLDALLPGRRRKTAPAKGTP